MDFIPLMNDLLDHKDEQQAIQMSAYMRDQFPFLGIQTPLRKKLCKEYFKAAKKTKTIDWGFIHACWRDPHRELQYIAIDYLRVMQEFLAPRDIPQLKTFIITKSWWDTVDGLDQIVGNILLLYTYENKIVIEWSTSDNIWLRRVAIDHQLRRKEKTDTELLEQIIVNNFGSNEFFINKAIGWALREYSKTNPEWVRAFIERYREQLSPLSIREASKYIPSKL